MKMTSHALIRGLLAAIPLWYCQPACALALSYSTTFDGISDVTQGSGAITLEEDPGSDFFGRTFNAPSRCCVLNGTTPTGYGFYDDFVFQVTAGSVSSIVATLDSASERIADLQERLYAVNVDGILNTVPTFGTPTGPVLHGWTDIGDGASINILDGILRGGEYVLEIRGNVTGSGGGSYAGTIDFSPSAVPVPTTLPMLLGGFAMTLLIGRRRQQPVASSIAPTKPGRPGEPNVKVSPDNEHQHQRRDG
jgi:hypothetical protein